MSQPLEERAARLLAPRTATETLPLSAAEHQAAVDKVAAALAARRRLQPTQAVMPSLWRRPPVWVALAASLLVGVGLGRIIKPSGAEGLRVAAGFATVSSARGSQLIQPGDTVGTEERLRTPAGGTVALTFSEGTEVTLGEKSDLMVHGVGAFRQFALHEGRFEAHVMKLHPGERFRLETERASIEVRGTRFTVEVQPPSDTCRNGATAVMVQEGVVTVEEPGQGLRFVRGGERYAAPCAPEPEATTSPAAGVAEAVPSKAGPVRRHPTPATASALSKMNSLYEQALAARSAGDAERAVALLRQLRAQFPAGQLDEAAAVEEMRLLEKLDPARARAAAQQYLLDYPEGYARDVAARWVSP